jgi:Membrane protein involved in the export of O-antigen and teichoic acid
MPGERRAHRLMANAVYNLIPQFWFLGLTVFTTPFVLHRLGVEAYGILSIITVVAGYLAFLDLGLNVAVIRFIAAHDAKGEHDEITSVTATALFVFSVMALITVAALFVSASGLARLLSVPAHMQSDAALALRLGGISFGLNLVMGVFSAVPRALQRFDVVNALNVVIGTLQIIVTVILLTLGLGLLAVMVWSCVLSALSLVIYLVVARRLLPAISVRPRFEAKKFRELYRFSGFVMMSNFTGVAAGHSEKLLLGGLAPIAQVTFYAVPFNIVSRVQMLIPSNLFTVLFPAFSAMSVTEKRETIQAAYLRAFKFIFLAVAPITILMAAFGADFLRLWIDAEMGASGGPVLAVLAVATLINAPAWVTVTVGQSLGKPGWVAAAQVVHLLVLILCGLLWIPHYGALGAASAWLAGNAVGIPVLVLLINRQVLAIRFTRMWQASLWRPLLVLLLTTLAALALKPIVHGVMSLAVASSIIIGLYLLLAYWVALDSNDQAILKGFTSHRFQSFWSSTPKIAKGQA